jgi:hypothetical protein
MANQKTDFARLLRIQRVVRSMRERDLSDARNRSKAAGRALQDIERMISDGGTVASLFPDILAKYLQSTLADKAAADQQVKDQGDKLLTEQRKLEAIEDRHKQQRRSEMNEDETSAQSETLDQRIAGRLSASSKLGKLG